MKSRYRPNPSLMIAVLALPVTGFAVDFQKDVKPILEAHCLLCHGTGKEKGGLQLHTREAMLEGGDSGPAFEAGQELAHNAIIDRITLDPADDEIMPQETDPLTEEEIGIIKTWVAAGAPWTEGVRLKAQKAPIPEEEKVIPRTPPSSLAEVSQVVDRIIIHENQKRKPQVAPSIDDLAFLRRATLDLVGRIPTLDEIREFESASPADRREELLARLLDSPRFADRWTVFYSDMLRVRSNAPGGRELQAWIHGQVTENRPYDKMAHELIAASGRTGSSPAVGFVLNDDTDPMSLAAAVSQIFLGVRLQCAQCHDHPFDDWNQREFYEMASFFGKTVRRESNFTRSVYTTETDQNRVMWPPERENPPSREAVKPLFPFELASYETKPHYIARFEQSRSGIAEAAAEAEAKVDLDALIDIDAGAKKGGSSDLDVLGEARKASEDLKVHQDLYKPSELRAELAGKVTNPRNEYFARAFVNRVWAELMGRGFLEPVDNFTAFQDISHPQALEYLSQEFIASGYDVKSLITTIMMTDTYRRGFLGEEASHDAKRNAELAFAASPARRMLAETLYDSVVIAGHLTEAKWRAGENVRMVARQIRIPIVEDEGEAAPEPAADTPEPEVEEEAPQMAAMNQSAMASAGAGYDLENSIEIDFKKVLSDAAAEAGELEKMRMAADMKLEQERMRRMAMENQRRPPMRYQLKTIEEQVDDNPRFNSSMRMASPAAPDHFLRVFGQPSREGLGEFRDHSPSLRQQLMMLNGKATHEAARVGTLEPLFGLLSADEPRIDQAIQLAYLECLTRKPTDEEMDDARLILTESESALEGMADLRWALLNSHEFRFLP